MVYQYRAYTLDKRIVKGKINASSENAAEEVLYRAGYNRVLMLKEIRPRFILERLLPSIFGIKAQEVIDFSRNLATLIESGMPILTALQLLEEQAPKVAFKKVIAGLGEELRGGSSFSQALSKYPQVFTITYCQMVKASEYAGNLASSLRQVATHIEKETATVEKARRVLAYPALVLLMSVGVFILLTTVALPPLVRLFTSLGAELPWTTKSLITISTYFAAYKFYLLGAVVILTISIIGYLRLPAGKLTIDRLMLKIPIIGYISIQRNMCQFCLTTSMLMKAGLTLPQIMNIVIGITRNRIISQALMEVRQSLVQGQGLSQPMTRIVLFPKLLVEMVAVGEKSGTLESTFATLADFYEQSVDQKVHRLISMIEPALTIGVGIVVSFIAVSMLTPLYSILRAMY